MKIAETVGNWLGSKSKTLRKIITLITFAIVIFVHGFWLRQFIVYDNISISDTFGFIYLEIVLSLMFGGPLCWFAISLMALLGD